MDDLGTLEQPSHLRANRRDRAAVTPSTPALTRFACLKLLSLAFADLAERDDIHQAARRLQLVLRWIDDEAARAAEDESVQEALAFPQRRRRYAGVRDARQMWRTL